MTAYELADYITENSYIGTVTMEDVATMLRQQQAEIAELKHMNRNWQISENILLLELEKLQHRELTDEEIIAVGNAVVNHIDSNEGWIEFARAILRKAQEK